MDRKSVPMIIGKVSNSILLSSTNKIKPASSRPSVLLKESLWEILLSSTKTKGSGKHAIAYALYNK